MKNTFNTQTITDELQKLCKDADPEIQKWVATAGRRFLLTEVAAFRQLSILEVGRMRAKEPWALKTFKAGTPIYEFTPHSLDFLAFARQLELLLPYLQLQKTLGVKLQHLKYNDVLTKKRQIDEELRVERMLEEADGDKVLVLALPDRGHNWYSLKTPRALRRESTHMNHCVGNFLTYETALAKGEIRIFSLRDHENMPHVTVAYSQLGWVSQIKGYGNLGVGDKYKGMVAALIHHLLKQGLIGISKEELELSKWQPLDLGVVLDSAGNLIL